MAKELDSAWQVFRLTLRYTAGVHAKAHVSRISSIPLEPTDPARLEGIVNAVLSELDRDAAAGEASPVLRAVQRTFRPSEADKDRRKLSRAFAAYVKAWRARGTV